MPLLAIQGRQYLHLISVQFGLPYQDQLHRPYIDPRGRWTAILTARVSPTVGGDAASIQRKFGTLLVSDLYNSGPNNDDPDIGHFTKAAVDTIASRGGVGRWLFALGLRDKIRLFNVDRIDAGSDVKCQEIEGAAPYVDGRFVRFIAASATEQKSLTSFLSGRLPRRDAAWDTTANRNLLSSWAEAESLTNDQMGFGIGACTLELTREGWQANQVDTEVVAQARGDMNASRRSNLRVSHTPVIDRTFNSVDRHQLAFSVLAIREQIERVRDDLGASNSFPYELKAATHDVIDRIEDLCIEAAIIANDAATKPVAIEKKLSWFGGLFMGMADYRAAELDSRKLGYKIVPAAMLASASWIGFLCAGAAGLAVGAIFGKVLAGEMSPAEAIEELSDI